MKILTIDDSISARMLVKGVLSDAGYEVVDAKDGQIAYGMLEKMDKSEIDLIISDINMPNLDGISFVKKVRTESKHKFVPIIMLTTESQEDKMKEGRQAGATAWIVKPFTPEQLLKVVNKIIPL